MMKKLDKKRTRILSRFCALLSSLLMCMLLTVPALASNNASTEKWYVADEAEMVNESGQNSRYLKLTPYVNGAEYAAIVESSAAFCFPLIAPTDGSYSGSDFYVIPINFPDWWRSAIPLGSRSYIELSKARVLSYTTDGSTSDISYPYDYFRFGIYSSRSALSFSVDTSVSADVSLGKNISLSGSLTGVPVSCTYYWDGVGYKIVSAALASAYLDGSVTVTSLDSLYELVYSASSYGRYNADIPGYNWYRMPFSSLSSADMGFYVTTPTVGNASPAYRLRVSVVVSFWVDANKLPSGLQVGDEFPANNDAFEALREDLIEQFPESEEHISNDKADWEDLRDAETIPEDAANSFFELLGGVFSIDMFGTIALMVCGFTALLILTRKAMN